MESLEPFVELFIFLFQLVGGLVLVWGGIRTVYYFFLPGTYPLLTKNKLISLEELLRVELGQKIVFALEFLVAGDILATLLQPTTEELYRLALLVVIRTVLSFFVGREVKQLDVHKHQLEREMHFHSKRTQRTK